MTGMADPAPLWTKQIEAVLSGHGAHKVTRAVLKLHRPILTTCKGVPPWWECEAERGDHNPWPCLTVEAIAEALNWSKEEM